MPKNLVIVESPAKAKTIEKFLGKDFKVMSSFGHIRDLKKKGLGIDIENQFNPLYEIPSDKKKVVADLTKAANAADIIWLASDEDREGEAIAWHLYEVLNLKEKTTHRIVFHEITKNAILEAIQNPRDINLNVVDAQQARRLLDRIVGFELSPVLWKKIKTNLSAGRVQSVAVRLVVEREREINKFQSEESYRVVAEFIGDAKTHFSADLRTKISNKEEAEKFLKKAAKASGFTVSTVDTKPTKRHPLPPFTTSTLQQEASRKYGFPVATTMQVAQNLYEQGCITYMRTDSVNLSSLALAATKQVIIDAYGMEYYNGHQYTTKSKGAQEAHEAIRPTYLENREIEGTVQERRLYDLIWKRTVASQMADAEIERTTVTVNMDGTSENFIAAGECVKFDGYRKIYSESYDDAQEVEQVLPNIKEATALKLDHMTATQRFTAKPARYTEASLVHKLEELGIGRPSTYAPIISTIIKREYVDKHEIQNPARQYTSILLQKGRVSEGYHQDKEYVEKGKLSPTDTGIVVNDYLIENFPNIMDYNFTASVEEQFDQIADGDMPWVDSIDHFYAPFHKEVDTASKSENKAKVGERQVGVDPVSGDPVFVKIGRYGPVAQIGVAGDDNKRPRFAALKTGQSIETITLEETLELFKLPMDLGEFEGKKLIVGVGKFGPYLRFGTTYVSVPKGEDPLTLTLERAEQIIADKRAADLAKIIIRFEKQDITVLHGRLNSIYITHKGENYRIPKDIDAEHITIGQCLEIIANDANKTKSKKTKKK